MITDHAQLAENIVEVLEDDTMGAGEIARQLARRGQVIPAAEVDAALRALTAAGRLTVRTILDRPCWRAA